MEKSNRCLISVAMITKNEEHNLDRALGSIKPYVDEIIVVDTGSTDKSVEIARKYTDKIYFYEWHDDFSAARNYSLQFPTCEWVLIYDADEEVREDFAGIREFLEKLPDDVNTVYLPTLNYLDWDLKKTEIASTARVFRNGTVKYENIIHNQAIYKGKIVEAPFTIYHYGYIWTRKLRKSKYERTRNLIVKLLNETKDLPSQERVYYLCQLYKAELIGSRKYVLYDIVQEILSIITSDKKMPSIGLEVLFMHSLDLNNKGFREEARNLLHFLLKVEPSNPDPYYALLAVEEAEENYSKVIEYGEEFLKKIDYVEKNPEKFAWTIISIKYVPSAHALLSIAYLRYKNVRKFKEHFSKAFDKSRLLPHEVQKFVTALLKEIAKTDDSTFSKVLNELAEILRISAEYELKISVFEILEKITNLHVEFDFSLFSPFLNTRFGTLVLEKLKSGKDGLISYVLGENEEEILDKIKEYGIEGLIFFHENMSDDDPVKLKILNKLRKFEDETISGISNALIGDINLRKANYSLALDYYKRASQVFPELSRFIKSVLDDLKTKLDPTIEGVFKELKEFYIKNKEFMVGNLRNFSKAELERLYLISDSDFAKYVSAVNIAVSNKEMAKRLFESITNKEDFQFLEYKYAKLFEESDKDEDLGKALDYHRKAVEKNVNLGDILIGTYRFDGFYPHEEFGNSQDKIVWVGNISEKHSGLGVISPIRVWRKGEKFYYASPFHTDEAIKIYKERLKTHKLPRLTVNKKYILEALSYLNASDIKLIEKDDEHLKIVKACTLELGIEYSEVSKNILSYELINTAKEFNSALKNVQSGVLFYFVPDFENREDMVWYYPLFRIIRTRKQVETELRNLGYTHIEHFVFDENTRAVLFKRK